jgi:hypothetical protein
MAKDLHKGIALDDKFNNAELRLQKALQDLEILYVKFKEQEHRPVESQTNRLIYAKGRAQTLATDFIALRSAK